MHHVPYYYCMTHERMYILCCGEGELWRRDKCCMTHRKREIGFALDKWLTSSCLLLSCSKNTHSSATGCAYRAQLQTAGRRPRLTQRVVKPAGRKREREGKPAYCAQIVFACAANGIATYKCKCFSSVSVLYIPVQVSASLKRVQVQTYVCAIYKYIYYI